MQITLPKSRASIYSFYVKKNKKNPIKSIITIIISILFIFCITLFAPKNNYKNNYFKARSYYMVSIYSTQNFSKVENLQLQVEDIGGAGYPYKSNNTYFIIARSYLSKDDAEKVVEKNSGGFPECSIIELSSKKIKRANKKKIEQNEFLLDAYKYICDLPIEIYNISINYDSGKISDRGVYKKMVVMKTTIDEHAKRVSGQASTQDDFGLIAREVVECLAVCKEDIEFSLNEQYRNDPLDLSLKLVGVKLCLNEISLKKAINNI